MLEVRQLRKNYQTDRGEVTACKDLSFSVQAGEILSLVGPSGCGKTSALRCVAGLERPDAGTISIDDLDVFSDRKREVPAHRRPVGMVFQSYAIWPHMTVFQNVAYPLTTCSRRKRPSKAQMRQQVMDVLEQVRIGELADRPASALSGGQQQRVAIARALLRNAKLLLFDEPLSNLDAKLREEMRGELRALFQHTDMAVLYVTHDLGEALAISDRLLVLSGGKVVQAGEPEEIYRRPRTEFVATFLGNANLLTASVRSRAGDQLEVDTPLGRHVVTDNDLPSGATDIRLLVRPEGLRLRRASLDGIDKPHGFIEASMFLGSTVEYRVRVGGDSYRVCAPPSQPRLAVDEAVEIDLDPDLAVPVLSDEVGVAAAAVRNGAAGEHEEALEMSGVA